LREDLFSNEPRRTEDSANCSRESVYYQCFVYVETDAMPVTGLYPRSEADDAEVLALNGYRTEEYGLVDDKIMVTREQYDDGAALIN
jgi:hypothetical protein